MISNTRLEKLKRQLKKQQVSDVVITFEDDSTIKANKNDLLELIDNPGKETNLLKLIKGKNIKNFSSHGKLISVMQQLAER